MKRVFLILVAMACLGVSGCSTKSVYIATPGTEHVDPASQFIVGNITNLSTFQFSPDEKNVLNPADGMKAALQAALSKRTMQAMEKQYSINVEILEYAPGDAGLRWLMPGLGATKLSVNAMILDGAGNECARIPVRRLIAAGGVFTVDAWKYVFDEVAEEIVSILSNSKNRNPASA